MKKSKEYSSLEEFNRVQEEFKHIEVTRRLHKIFNLPSASSVLYSPDQNLKAIFRLQSTAVITTLLRLDFWILLIFHSVISVIYYKFEGNSVKSGVALEETWPKAHISLVSFTGSLLIFGLVFYINRTYSRYHLQYLYCKGAAATLGDIIVYLRTTFSDEVFPEAEQVRVHISKLLNAGYVLAFAGLPQYRSVGIHYWAWDYVTETDLLTKKQADGLMDLMAFGDDGRLAFKQVMSWVRRAIWVQVQKGHIVDKIGTRYSSFLLRFESNLDILYSYSHGPMPHAYCHHLHFVIRVYLFFLGYAFAFQTAYYTIIPYSLILLAFLSGLELGDMLADPFGNDALDIPVFDLVEECRRESLQLAQATIHPGGLPDTLALSDKDHGPVLQRLSRSNQEAAARMTTDKA